MTAKKRTAKPNIRPDWMKEPPKVSKEYAEKRAQIVREWDTWPKATEARAHRADQRLEAVFNRTGRNDEKRVRTLQKIEAMDIPARLKPEVARLREYLGSGIHDPIAIITLEMFFLGVELQSLFPEFRKQIAGRKLGTAQNKRRATEEKKYARDRFIEIRANFPKRKRKEIIGDIRSSSPASRISKWPCKRIEVGWFKGLK